MKHINKNTLICASLLLISFLSHSQKENSKKWHFGIAAGTTLAAQMHGKGVVDDYHDFAFYTGFSSDYYFTKNFKHSLSFGIGYNQLKNRFSFYPIFQEPNGATHKEYAFIEVNQTGILLDFKYKYSVLIKNDICFRIGAGVDLINFPTVKGERIHHTSSMYISTHFPNFAENFYGGALLTPLVIIEKEIFSKKNYSIDISYSCHFYIHQNLFWNNVFFNFGGLQPYDAVRVREKVMSNSIMVTLNF
jgi:hypothetical protein